MGPDRSGVGERQALRAPAIAVALGLPLVVAALVVRRQLAPDGVAADDAYIFLRYARNLARGLGWVWNPGGPPVEGTTSTLWTLLAAAAHRASAAPQRGLFALSLVAVIAALSAWVATVLSAGAFAIGLDLALRPAFAYWTAVSLMDGGIWCAALLLAAATLARSSSPRASRATVVAAAAAQVVLALARPEALLVGPLFVAVAAIPARTDRRRWLVPFGAALATQAGLLVWRLATFGWPLPNTYYAKVGADLAPRLAAGGRYLLAAAGDDPTRPVLWLAALVALVGIFRRARSPAREPSPDGASTWALAAAGTLAGPVIVLFEGGDHFPGFRSLVLLRPFETTLALLVVARLAGARGRSSTLGLRAAAAMGLVSLAGCALAPARWSDLAASTGLAREIRVARGQLALADRLNALFGEDEHPPTIGVVAAGALPWRYRGPSADLMGLNDATMAHATRQRTGVYGHAAFSAAPFFAAPPDLLVVTDASCTAAARVAERLVMRLALADVDRDPRFAATFDRVRLSRPGADGEGLCLFARREWLAAAADQRAGFTVERLGAAPARPIETGQ